MKTTFFSLLLLACGAWAQASDCNVATACDQYKTNQAAVKQGYSDGFFDAIRSKNHHGSADPIRYLLDGHIDDLKEDHASPTAIEAYTCGYELACECRLPWLKVSKDLAND